MIGAGCLAMPSAFHRGGLLASSLLLCLICYWLVVSCIWEGRCIVNAARILSCEKSPENTEVFGLFAGQFWKNVYSCIFFTSFMSCNWAFAILFAHTLESAIPSIYHGHISCSPGESNSVCDTRYAIYIAILAIFTTPLAIMDISEQWWVQNPLTVLRILRLLFMCITPIIVGSIGYSMEMQYSFPSILGPVDARTSTAVVFGDIVGLGEVASAAVFSLFLNGSISVILDSLEDKRTFTRVLKITFGVCLVLYIGLSVIVSLQFGSYTANPCNLNWRGYRWPAWLSTSQDGLHMCSVGSICDLSAKVVEFTILFTPALDVVSAYPFISIIVGNSITEIMLGTQSDEQPPPYAHHDDEPTPSSFSSSSSSSSTSHIGRRNDYNSGVPTETTPLIDLQHKNSITNTNSNHSSISISSTLDTLSPTSPTSPTLPTSPTSPTIDAQSRSISPPHYKAANMFLRFLMNTTPLILAATISDFETGGEEERKMETSR